MCLTLASPWQHLAVSFVLRVPQEKELRVIAHVTLHCSACTFPFPAACPNHLAPLRPVALGIFVRSPRRGGRTTSLQKRLGTRPRNCPNRLAPLRPMALGSFFAHRAEAVERPARKSARGHDPGITLRRDESSFNVGRARKFPPTPLRFLA